MNTEQRKLMTMIGLYGASAAQIAKHCNAVVDRQSLPYQPRKMGLNDLRIAEAKRAAIKATASNDIGIKPLDRGALHICTALVKERFAYLHDQPSNFQGAQRFRSSGDFTGIAAVGFC